MRCDVCRRTLAWYDLVPFASFIALRGRCRTCHASFGWNPLLWEAGGAMIVLAIAIPILLTRST